MFLLYTVETGKAPLDWLGMPWLGVAPDRTPERFQFIVEERSMEPVEDALRFLLYSVSIEQVRLETERARAGDLYEWLMYRGELGRDLSDIEQSDLVEYRDRLMTQPSLKTGEPLAATTVRRRLSTLVSFYEWADSSGRIPNDIGASKKMVRLGRGDRRDMLAHLGSSTMTKNDILPKVQKRLPEFIEEGFLRGLFAELGSPPANRDGRPARDWLIVYLSLFTGMRRAEVAALTVHQFQSLAPSEEAPARLALTATKGGKPRSVPIESFVLDQVKAYVDGERKAVLRAAKAKGKFRHRKPTALFVNGPHCATKYLGNPITTDMIDRMFLRTQRRLASEDGAHHGFHHLRHTHVMRRRLAGDEWDNISRDLGHAQIGTTINVYARALNRVEPEARARYVLMLRKLAGA
jgi:integrase